MAYTHQRHPRYQDAKYNYASNLLTYTVVQDALEATASAVTVTIYEPGSSTEALAAASMSAVGGTDSQWSYTLDTTTVADWPVQVGYRCEIKYTISGVDYYDQVYLAVVYHPLVFGLVDDALTELESELGTYFASGRTDHARKILAAENMIRADIYQTILGGDGMYPSRVNGYAQLFEWHRALTLHLIMTDLGQIGEGSKADYYERMSAQHRSATKATISYSRGEEENPNPEDTDNATTVFLSR